ncbi:conserved hypothetical phage-related protein [Pectobacterium atrosepticum SCRI1043]|uniref:Prophage protein n=2 Tax=Pectobacterium TaxID=122277 RepID=A0A093TBR2_9GAMM|nr:MULTISPECIES: hypothetical protein [Pectobacterium]AIA72721.1 hypothetical protein EV46_19590 [Pectobacterium atrosepticum]AIK15704.1 hypothetical protein GZ59_39930 [Pectobacterium atrosepticum]KFX07776.1 hypothetical protein KP22_06710 [Pectobacterium betavasculorum]KFX19791.1 hypothetical protein JV35_12810 [Pectobacterium betavasculorum]MCL6317825.1 hypothetical protein [Pectobacterium atrosepticum]
MTSVLNIDEQLSNVQAVMTALRAMNATVHSVMLKGSQPVIRIARNGHCAKLIENGVARYVLNGVNNNGRFRQGEFEQHGCRIIWSESLH